MSELLVWLLDFFVMFHCEMFFYLFSYFLNRFLMLQLNNWSDMLFQCYLLFILFWALSTFGRFGIIGVLVKRCSFSALR